MADMLAVLAVLVVLAVLYAGLKAFTYSDEYYNRFDKGAR